MASAQPEFLTAEELQRLTDARRGAEQDKWLVAQGIPHKVDGKRVIVSRLHVRAWLEGKAVAPSNSPNWDKVA